VSKLLNLIMWHDYFSNGHLEHRLHSVYGWETF